MLEAISGIAEILSNLNTQSQILFFLFATITGCIIGGSIQFGVWATIKICEWINNKEKTHD